EAIAYPLVNDGRVVDAMTPQGPAPGSLPTSAEADAPLVLLCDRLFDTAIGARCGGPAEALVTAEAGGSEYGPLLDRFEAAAGRFVSVYGPASR
ncbi:MAG: hypothetical protein WKF56_09535, partial [Candidatus Limnocylindrales bacterium]